MKEIFLRKSALIQKSFNREMDYWEFHGKTCFTMQFDQKNSHLDCSSTHNYESSNYTQGDGWSSFYHSGSFGSGYFYDDYDFTADWSESFNGVTNSYSNAHSASNNVEGDNYSLSGCFSDYYKTWDGQSPDSGGYSDSYPSSSPSIKANSRFRHFPRPGGRCV